MEKLNQFLRECDYHAEVNEYRQEEVKNLFCAAVRRRITDDVADKITDFDGLDDWVKLRKAIVQAVKPPDSSSLISQEIDAMTHKKGESAADFGKRFLDGVKRLKAASSSGSAETKKAISDMIEQNYLKTFMMKYKHPQVKNLLLGTTTMKTIQDAVNFAVNRESLFQGTNDSTCNYCHNKGHEEKDCRKKASLNGNKKNGNQFRQKFNSNNKSNSKELTCYKCGQKGHKAPDCGSSSSAGPSRSSENDKSNQNSQSKYPSNNNRNWNQRPTQAHTVIADSLKIKPDESTAQAWSKVDTKQIASSTQVGLTMDNGSLTYRAMVLTNEPEPAPKPRTEHIGSTPILLCPFRLEGNQFRITLEIDIATRPVNLLIDCGAMISLLNGDVVKPDAIYYPTSFIRMTGIDRFGDPIRSLGMANANVLIPQWKEPLPQQFHLVNNSIRLETDGLLGIDFVIRYLANINARTLRLEIVPPNIEPRENWLDKVQQFPKDVPIPGPPSKPPHDCICHIRKDPAMIARINQSLQRYARILLEPTDLGDPAQAIQIKRANVKPKKSIIMNPQSVMMIDAEMPENQNWVLGGDIVTPGVQTLSTISPTDGKGKLALVNTNDFEVTLTPQDIASSATNLNEYRVFCIQQWNQNNEEERVNYILENLLRDLCNREVHDMIDTIANEFHKVFHVPGDEPTFTEAAMHHIPLKPGTKPIFTPQYRIPYMQQRIVEEEIRNLLSQDIVEPSKSAWNSPLLLVPKKPGPDGEKRFRLCVDFRRLNEVTLNETHPMIDFERELDRIRGATIFSTLDLHAAFHQIAMAPEDRELTAFQTSTQKLHFKRMPFGLKGAPITWQRTINNIMRDLLNENIICYMDDLICWSNNMSHHLNLLKKILNRLYENGLRVNAEKTKLCADLPIPLIISAIS